MGYSLKFRLRKAIAEQCDEWFSGYEDNDVVIDYFDNSKDDPKTWLTNFCCWARQEELPDYFKLDCAIVAMNHTHAFPAETSEDGGTWDEFVHVFKEKLMGDCKCWAGTESLPYDLFFDGAVRPHPCGNAGIGAVLFSPTWSNCMTLVCKYLGRNVTNNSAEYLALIYGLKTALSLGVRRIQVYGDSQLVVHQIQVNGKYTASDSKIKGYLSQVWSITRDFQSFQIDHIGRNSNKEADKVANEAIDKHCAYISRREVLQSGNPQYKTRFCRYWSRGYCYHEPDSVNCPFAHGEEDLMGSDSPRDY